MRFSSTRLVRTVALAALIFGCCSCSSRERTSRMLEQAQRYHTRGDLDKAEIEFKNVLQKDPQNAAATASLGLLYHEQGRDSRAAAYLLRAKELQPDNIPVRHKLALAHLAAGGLKEAREEALFILERHPDDPDAPRMLVEGSRTPQEVEDARQRLLALPPSAANPAARLVALGIIAMRQDRLQDAESTFNAANAADPKWTAADGSIGMLRWTQKNSAAAEAAFKQAAELSPARSPKRLHYARFKLQSGDAAGARALLEEITRQTPDYLPSWVMLADLALSERRFDDADAALAKTFAREPLHPDSLLISARVRFAKGDTEKAVQEFDRLLTMFPRSPQIAYQLSLALAAQGDTNKAIARLNQVISAAPEMTQAVVTLGEVHLRRRDYSAALTTLRPLVQQHPELATARILLAEAHRGQGDLDEALALYTTLQQERPSDVQIAFARATVLLQQKKFPEARKEFLRVRELQPDHLGALEQLVDSDLAGKQPAAARERVEADLARNPKSPQLALLLAKIHSSQGNTDATEAALLKTIELQPESAMAHYELMRLYVNSNRQEKAIASLRESISQNPNSLSPVLLLGVLLDESKDYAGAREAYEKALVLEPKSTLALNNLAYLYCERFDEADRAVELAQRARALQPQEPRTADTLGWALTKKKQYGQALILLQESASRLPNEPDVHYHLGVTHYQLADEDSARRSLQRALELNPTFSGAAEAQRRLALLKIDPAGVTADARTSLEQQLARQPDDPVAQLRLAESARGAGKIDQALAHYRKLLQSHPKHAQALINVARIHSEKGELPAAFEAAKAARNSAPENRAIMHTVGRIAYDSGEHRWAASLLQDLAKHEPASAEILFDWAEAAYSVGRVDDAATALNRSREIGGNYSRAPAAERFAEMLALSVNPASATAAARPKVEQALKANPSLAPALMTLALIEEQEGDQAAARRAYETLLNRFPEFSPACRNLTLLYAATSGDAPNATAIATKARQAFPADLTLARASGVIAYRQGDFAKAIILLRDYVNKNASDGETLYYYGMAQCRTNKEVEGRQTLQRALEIGLQESLATEAKKRIASAR